MVTNQILYRLNKKREDTKRKIVVFLTFVRFASNALSVILVIGICFAFLKEVNLKVKLKLYRVKKIQKEK